MNPFLKGFLAVLILAGLSGASYAEANQTVIQGVTPNGQGMTLPRSLCAYPGQAIRIGAMVIDYGGRPVVTPAERIYRRVVQAKGNALEWSPSWGPVRGPFRRDPYLERAIQLTLPTHGRFRLTLEAQAREASYTSIRIVDPRGAGPRACQWGPQSMYLNSSVADVR